MLGKLFKHELKATYRLQLPITAAVIVVTLVEILLTTVSGSMKDGTILNTFLAIVTTIVSIAYVLMLIAYILTAHFIGIQRYYKNIFTDEGYLTLTLPVKTGYHQFVKLVVALFWAVVSIVVLIGCVYLILGSATEFISPIQLWAQISDTYSYLHPTALFLLTAVAVLASEISFFTMAYFCIAVGQTFSKKHKVAAALVTYLVLYTILQTALFFLIIGGVVVFGDQIESVFNSGMEVQVLYGVLIGSSAFSLLLSGVMYGITNYFTRRKLNLE